MTKSSNWFVQHGCELVKPNIIVFLGVYDMSGGNPCNQCNCKDTCPAWPLLQRKERVEVSQQGRTVETNAQIAKRLGISKRQVTKMRREGKLQ